MDKNQLLLILAIAAAVTVVGAGAFLGFSTLSLTQGTNYISSDPFFQDAAYTLVAAVDGSSASAKGTITPDVIRSFTGSQAPSGNFDLQIDLQNQSCTYALLTPPIPVYTYSNFQYQCSSESQTQCTFTRSQQIGEVYQIDSVAHYDSRIKITLTPASSQPIVVSLSPTQTSGEIPGIMRANLVGGLQGVQSCPVPSSTILLYRPGGTNELQPKSAAYLSQLTFLQNRNPQGYIEGPLYTPPAGYTVDSANNIANLFVSSSAASSSFCEPSVISSVETLWKCQPASPVYIPLIRMVIKASVLGVVIPSSQPDIISISSPIAEAAQVTKFEATIRNAGIETDSFDLQVTGSRQVNLESSRISLAAGAQTTVPIRIQGSGIIGNYILTARSVNSPLKTDSLSFKLLIDPFCDKPAEAGKQKVSTEYGCYYVCANQFQSDIREKTCQAVGTFEPNGRAYDRSYGSGINQTSLKDYNGEYHCTGIGAYMVLDDYMDSVLAGRSRPFVPKEQSNAVWISAPTCNYFGEYGFKWNGLGVTEVQNEEFNYALQPTQGNLQVLPPVICTMDIQMCSDGSMVGRDSGNGCNFKPCPTTHPPPEPFQPPSDNNTLIFAIVAAAIIGWKVILKK